jgi:hypothetical protein
MLADFVGLLSFDPSLLDGPRFDAFEHSCRIHLFTQGFDVVALRIEMPSHRPWVVPLNGVEMIADEIGNRVSGKRG